MQQRETISHQIVLDPFMILEWKIPKVITPLELKAMSYKINKLFNLSEVQMVAEKESPKVNNTKEKGKTHWTDDLVKELIRLNESGISPKGISKRLYEMTGDPYYKDVVRIKNKIYYETAKLTSKPKGKVKEKSMFSIRQVLDTIAEIYNSGMHDKHDIRKELHGRGIPLSKNQVKSKIIYLKKTGKIIREENTNGEATDTNQDKLQESQDTVHEAQDTDNQ